MSNRSKINFVTGRIRAERDDIVRLIGISAGSGRAAADNGESIIDDALSALNVPLNVDADDGGSKLS